MNDETQPAPSRTSSDIYSPPITDGLTNVVSGLGTAKARAPHSYLNQDRQLDRIDLEDVYRYYWISKAVDIKPWDMTREWRTFCGDGVTPEQIKLLEEEERRVEARADVREALVWASLYGGAGLVMHVNGQGNMSTPLDVTKVKRGQLSHLTPVDRWELLPAQSTIDYNPLSKNFGTAEWYRIANDTQGNMIHRSRIVFFRGRKMPIRVTRLLWGWGESDVQRWYKAITNSETLSAAILEGVHQSNIDVVSTAGLKETLPMEGGEELVKKRFMLLDYCKSLLNMAVIDGEDTFTRNAFSFAGLPDLKKIFMEELSAATDYPVTKLLGSSASGLNATGEGDLINYYDGVASSQENDLAPKLHDLDQVLVRSALGVYPESLSFEFNSLWQVSDKEQAEINSTNANTLGVLYNIGIPEEVLLRDAVEMGLVKNMSEDDIDAMEKDGEFDIEEGNEDFEPENKGAEWLLSESGKEYRIDKTSGKRIYKDGQ